MKYLSILSLIILVIFISGCTTQITTGGGSTKNGVVITEFAFENAPVYTEENVGLRLEVQNVGGNAAVLKKIQIYGVDFGTDDDDWSTTSGDEILDEFDEELYKPDPDFDLEGAKFDHEWRLKVPKKVFAETKYDFAVRIDYDYGTTYTGIIRLVDEDYLQSLSDEERNKLYGSGGIISSKLTNGPISIIPFEGRHFIVDELTARTIQFKVENVGTGYPYICDDGTDCVSDDDNAKKYYLTIRDEPNNIVKCGDREIKLSSGKSHILYCTFDPEQVGDFINKVDKTFQIEFEYSYYIDGYTSVVVNPTFEGGIGGSD